MSAGGHDVPADIVLHRFSRSTHNFFTHYRQSADSWFLFDNSGQAPDALAFEQGKKLHILRTVSYSRLLARYGGKE